MNEDPDRLPLEPHPIEAPAPLSACLLPPNEIDELARFTIESRCCRNPECDCQELILDLHDPASEERFSIILPLDQRPPFIYGPHPEEMEDLLQELRNRLGLPFWERAKREYEAAKEYGRRNPWEYLTFERGLLVPYYELAPGPDEVLEFTHEGNSYIVIDQYCLKPDCDCRDVLLDVQRLRSVAAGRAKADPFAVTNYDFRQWRFTPGRQGPLTSHARKVMASFMASRPEMKTVLWERYARAKEIGRKVAERGGFVDPEPVRPGGTRVVLKKETGGGSR